MKASAGIAIVLIVLAMAVPARAQTQTCTSPIAEWTGQYTLSVSGTGTSPDGFSWTVNESATATVNAPLQGASCTIPSWIGQTALLTITVNDQGSRGCPPPVGGTETFTITGSSSGISSSIINIDVAGTYTYFPASLPNVTITGTDCSGVTKTSPSVPWPLYPGNWLGAIFPLPIAPQSLTQNMYTFPGLWAFGPLTLPWTLSFTLDPVYNDDSDCQQNGGAGEPVNSSINCQRQSLGEDVPIVGTRFNLHYESERAPGAGGSGAASADAFMIGGWTLSVHHAYDPASNTLFLGDGRRRSAYQLGAPVVFNGNFLVTSEDGSEIYVFSGSTGQHLQTQRPLTGALLYQFSYDAAGNLATVTDANGNVTTVQRDAAEHPTAIVSPYGQNTTLTLDSNSFLSQVTDPLGQSATFTNSSTGLLASRTDEKGNAFSYTYDSQGRLTRDADSLGGFTALTRTKATSGFGWTVGETTSVGRTSSYQSNLNVPWVQTSTSTFSKQHTNTWRNGLQASSTKTQQGSQISESVTLPDGTSYSETLGPDPIWGIQVPVATSQTLTQGNLTMNVSESRTATLGAAGNPFSLVNQTDTRTVNSRTYTSNFTAPNLTLVDTTPAGRTMTTVLDNQERPASIQIGGLLASNFTYDGAGRLSTVTQGTRTSTFTYDGHGKLAAATDPLGLQKSFSYDADGRLLSTTLADGRVIGYSYDANRNLTSVTPPGKPAHNFAYTAVNQMSQYQPPSVAGTGSTTYSHNLDRDITQITRPDGNTIAFNYDNAGRLSSLVTPSETINHAYDSTTGNLTSANIANGEAISYGYNGSLPTSTSWTGAVAGTVSRTYDNNFWVVSQGVNGGSTIAFSYDNDGLPTQAGALSVTNDANGLVTGTTLGSVQDSWTYNGYGELVNYTASFGAAPLYSVSFVRDAAGRITSTQETINGTSNSYTYAYDAAGRLTQAGDHIYTYDSNSNRLTDASSSGTQTGTYDAQDRLLTYGNASYTYTANGESASRADGAQVTLYLYDVLGNLVSATLPDGTAVTYVIDAENRRVGKRVNGQLTTGFLYNGDRVVAQLDGNSRIISQFVYATRGHSPDYMLQAGVAYRILSDELGSPRLVVNTSTGTIAEQITYDGFGNVLSDSNPGFQPFGFAGGLYDQDTKLVRFDARDYDPVTGRWTAKDPILFAGGDSNLYGYVLDDPVNGIDPSGLQQCNSCKLKEFREPEKKEPPKSETDEIAKEAGKKIVKMQLKTFGKSAEEKAEIIREGVEEEVTPPSPSEEYKQQLDRAQERCDDSVNPFKKKVEKTWIQVLKALAGFE